MSDFTRKIQWKPGFDKRNPDPHKNYGIAGVQIYWTLIGPLGAITWDTVTDWYPKNVWEEKRDSPTFYSSPSFGLGSVSYHSYVQHYEGQEHSEKDCEYIGVPCYSDCSFLLASDVFQILVEQGEEATWKKLEEIYNDWLVRE